MADRMKIDPEIVEETTTYQKYWSKTQKQWGDTTIASQRDSVVESGSLHTIGEETPGFHKRRRKGELLPLTNFYQFDEKQSCGTYRLDYTVYSKGSGNLYQRQWSTGRRNHHKYNHLISSNECEDIVSSVDAMPYVQNAAAKIYSSGMDVLTFGVELPKTVRLFQRIVPRLIKYIKQARVEDAWLEARYGWRLLLFDMEEISDLIKKIDAEGRLRLNERAGNTIASSRDHIIHSWSGNWSKMTATAYDDYRLSVRGSIVADLKQPEAKVITNLGLTAYELTPYSFILDWVINVGTALEVMSFKDIAAKYYASQGYRLEMTRQTELVRTNINNGSFYGDIHNPVELQTTHTIVYNTRQPVALSSMPRINLNLDAYKVVDLIALLTSAVKR